MHQLVSSPSIRQVYRSSALLTLLVFLTLCTAWVQAKLPALLGSVIDQAVQSNVDSSAIMWYAVLSICTQFLLWICAMIATHTRWSGTNALRRALLANILVQPLAFFRTHGVGELTERLESDISEAADFFAGTCIQLLGATVLCISIFALSATFDGTAAIVFFCYVLCGGLIVYRTQQDHTALWEVERRADAAAFDSIEEVLVGRTALQAVHAQSFASSMLSPKLDARLNTHRRASLQSQTGTVVAGIVSAVGWCLAAVIGVWRFWDGSGSVGDVVTYIGFVRLLAGPIDIFGTQYAALLRARAAFTRCDALFVASPERFDGDAILPSGPLAVSVDDVTFVYAQNDRFTLSNVTLPIPAGSQIAVIGRTGSGKTTLGRLITRLEQPHAGSISLAGIPLVTVSEVSLRQRVGVISQEIDIFPTTLRENLRAYDRAISDTAITQLIAQLGLLEWYATFPAGLNTPLGDGERDLTPGEAQLVALVRIALRHPGLVILDEASAHIDPQTERLLREASRRVARDRTTITIAHRLSTIEHADMVGVFADGRIVECGVPAELAKLPQSHYARMRAGESDGEI